jgi:murein DD-endopeptidase MepM/ murein hydrolase activator NlpD
LASPLDETPDIIAKKYDYYNFGSEWTATYCGGKPKRHVGVDLGVKFEEGKKIPVYAVASGQVKADYLCSTSYDWARGIVIDHDGAFTTVYEHINPLVSVGQHVNKGQQIATVAKIEGNYQHLHFGIKCGGYEAISTRGALPVEHGPCDKKIDCSTSGCRCDPLFPGPFIDPLDARIVYEKHNSLQETIQSQSPTVQAFQVTPQSLTSGESFTIEYTVSDTRGSGLNRVELWRKDEQSDWQEIKRDALSGGDGPISGSFSDAPSDSGKYWYGIHVVDNAGNWNDEKNSNSNYQPTSYSPVEVEVRSTQPAETQENSDAIALNDNGVALYNQGKYEEALECFNEATRIDPKYAKAWDNKATVLLALNRCDEFKAADEMAESLGLINFRNPLTYIKCG